MGTWGTPIFSDDFAMDLRREFRDTIGYGKSPADATAELIVAYEEVLTDPDESCVFWLALAAATTWHHMANEMPNLGIS